MKCSAFVHPFEIGYKQVYRYTLYEEVAYNERKKSFNCVLKTTVVYLLL